MKKVLITIMGLLFVLNSYPQDKVVKLTDEVKVSYKDILELRLQILASQISCGSHRIIDMGKIDFPVSITINDKNIIVFEVEGEIKQEYSKDIQKDIISESFEFVEVSIKELIWRNYPQLDWDFSKNIIGYWYYEDSEGHIPHAKWESGSFSWINNP